MSELHGLMKLHYKSQRGGTGVNKGPISKKEVRNDSFGENKA
jgi:hypothetical protein